MTDSDDYRRGDALLHDWAEKQAALNSAWGYPRESTEYRAIYGSPDTSPDRLTRPEQDADRLSSVKSVDRIFMELPQQTRDAVTLRYIAKMTWTEIGRELQIHRDIAKDRVYMAALTVAHRTQKMAA